jgi:NAD+ dependent glucose-6-phosphate dehydrogenase
MHPDDPHSDGKEPGEGPPEGLPILHQADDVEEGVSNGSPDPDEMGEDEFIEDEVRTVLITGACGNIGRKLRAAWEDEYDLVLIDVAIGPDDHDVIMADLAEWDPAWVEQFEGVDTVIHLAANPDEFAPWEELERPNLDAACNVFQAAILGGVTRLVFASSNHTMGGYRDLGDMPITVHLPPRPDSPYGATKLMAERMARALSDAYQMSFVALRLGWIQAGANRPETLPDEWARAMWLSNGDLVRLFTQAVEVDLGDEMFVVVNGMSNNRGMRWDLSEAMGSLGYEPEGDAYAEEL